MLTNEAVSLRTLRAYALRVGLPFGELRTSGSEVCVPTESVGMQKTRFARGRKNASGREEGASHRLLFCRS